MGALAGPPVAAPHDSHVNQASAWSLGMWRVAAGARAVGALADLSVAAPHVSLCPATPQQHEQRSPTAPPPQVVRNRHDKVPNHGAGKCMAKADGARLLRQMLQLGLLMEDTYRQDNSYGAISSAIKVASCRCNLCVCVCVCVPLPVFALLWGFLTVCTHAYGRTDAHTIACTRTSTCIWRHVHAHTHTHTHTHTRAQVVPGNAAKLARGQLQVWMPIATGRTNAAAPTAAAAASAAADKPRTARKAKPAAGAGAGAFLIGACTASCSVQGWAAAIQGCRWQCGRGCCWGCCALGPKSAGANVQCASGARHRGKRRRLRR